MPEILHRISVDAAPATVHDLVATTDGIGAWWTGRPALGDPTPGGTIAVYFGDADSPAATFTVESDTPDAIVWRCVSGPADWLDTRISFAFRATDDGATTLLFEHSGWREASEFMAGCSTNWGAYLTSLKHGAEGGGFGAYPHGEISRWG
jgi:hypothetical protein